MEPVQSLIAATVARAVRPAPLSPEKVLFAWRVAVGPAVARVTRVRLASGRVLEVQVDDDRFGEEIVRSTEVVLRRVQDLLGAETVGRLDVRRPPPPRSGRRRGLSRPKVGRNAKGDTG